MIQRILGKPERLCAGVMSGTSLDGLDVAICRISGAGERTKLRLAHFESFPYSEPERERILRACSPETSNVAEICALHKWMGAHIGKSVAEAMRRADIPMEELDFVASHGQTVYHMPEIGATLQIGEAADIAAITGKPVVADFRPSDMAYGGQGAPLAPFFDYILCRSGRASRLLLNAGGIANITALKAGSGIEELIAFDTGPANVTMNNLMKIHAGKAFDENGAAARAGTISSALLESMIAADAFPALPPPKSTGRELYTITYAERLLAEGLHMRLSFEDIVATATEYSAYCVERAVRDFLPFSIGEYYLSGGGWHNPFFRERLEKRLGSVMRPLSEILDMDGDAKEAAFFAVFGNEFLHGHANNARAATGADRNVIMGKLTLPSQILH